MADEKKKYWIKLEKDFLNSSQIKVIKNMANGKDYIIFYLAIMLESTNTEGHLRFSELVPYNEEMLASVTDTNVDIVRSAMKIFQSLGMLQILENGTIFLPDVPKRVGKESESAERVRLYRERQALLQCNDTVTICNNNKEEDKEKKEDKQQNIYLEEEEQEDKKSSLPASKETKHKYGTYKKVLLTDAQYQSLLKKLGNDMFNACVTHLDNYCEANGRTYKNYAQAILNWVVDAVKEKEMKTKNASKNSGGNVFVRLGQDKGVF